MDVLRPVGFNVPEFVTYPGLHDASKPRLSSIFQNRSVETLVPWGSSPDIQNFVTGATTQSLPLTHSADLCGKDLSAELAQSMFDDGLLGYVSKSALSKVCRTEAEGLAAIESCLETTGRAVLKARFSSSGRDRVFVERLPAQEKIGFWMKKQTQKFGSFVVQPWLKRLGDFSMQMKVHDGHVSTVALTRFVTTNSGGYVGTLLGKPLADFSKPILRFLHNDGNADESVLKNFETVAKRACSHLASMGYSGPVGIDGLLFELESRFQFHPLLEINPRHTMGLVAAQISKRIVPATPSLWLQLNCEDIRTAGFESVLDFATVILQRHPSRLEHNQIESGIVFTNDFRNSSHFVSLVVVGQEALTDICQRLKIDIG